MAHARADLAAGGARWSWLAWLALALAPWVLWRSMLSLELLGWDSYPLIAASRLERPLDALRLFGQELMDGRYPLGSYWRPLTQLSIGLDHALWGLRPRGYHATDLALLSLNSLALGVLARRWFGLALGVAAGLWFAANLTHVDVLPAPARRADALALLFTLCALLCAGAARSTPRVRRAGAATCCALALMAKEAGIVAVALVWLQAALAGPPRPLSARLAAAAREGWLVALVVAAVLLGRGLVLGGLGGAKVGAAESVSAASETWLRYAPATLLPSGLRSGWLSERVVAALGLGVVAAAVALGARSERRHPRALERCAFARHGRFLFFAAWFAALAALTTLARAERSWYELPFAALNALLAAGLAELALALVAPRWSELRRGALAAIFLLALSWPGLQLALAPRTRLPAELAAASAAQGHFMEELERALLAARPGQRLAPEGFVAEVLCREPGLDGRPRSLAVLAPYSVRAFATLVVPDKKVRVTRPALGPVEPAPDEIVVTLR